MKTKARSQVAFSFQRQMRSQVEISFLQNWEAEKDGNWSLGWGMKKTEKWHWITRFMITTKVALGQGILNQDTQISFLFLQYTSCDICGK